jgi:hypothetical protein
LLLHLQSRSIAFVAPNQAQFHGSQAFSQDISPAENAHNSFPQVEIKVTPARYIAGDIYWCTFNATNSRALTGEVILESNKWKANGENVPLGPAIPQAVVQFSTDLAHNKWEVGKEFTAFCNISVPSIAEAAKAPYWVRFDRTDGTLATYSWESKFQEGK